MTSIANIVDAIANPYCVWRTLRDIKPEMASGRPRYVVGNSAVTLFVRHRGEPKVLKCYTRTHKNLPAIYGEDFHARELCVSDLTGRRVWIDCLLMPLAEGDTLDAVLRSTTSPEVFYQLATAFDAMARELLSSPRAHGNLKPENIIVTPDLLSMSAIDWDAAYLPQFSGEKSSEIGTAAYQHPSRTVDMFDKHIDDYSIATISTLLHAMAIDPSIADHYRSNFEPPFSPKQLCKRQTQLLDPIIDHFAKRGMAQQYHIAKMLTSTSAHLFRLQEILEFGAIHSTEHNSLDDNTLQADEHNGLWGCRAGNEWLVAPLFESAFDPSDGTMLVELGRYKHFIALDSRILVTFDRQTIVKPFRNGQTTIHKADGESLTLYCDEILQTSTK
ncbi:MAG: hypothetical protein IKY80_01600 [Alistipes sp.]|nr:hypothetical protein [Alistipes sp.]